MPLLGIRELIPSLCGYTWRFSSSSFASLWRWHWHMRLGEGVDLGDLVDGEGGCGMRCSICLAAVAEVLDLGGVEEVVREPTYERLSARYDKHMWAAAWLLPSLLVILDSYQIHASAFGDMKRLIMEVLHTVLLEIINVYLVWHYRSIFVQ